MRKTTNFPSPDSLERTEVISRIALRLDFFTEDELQILADVKLFTLEAWRKRGIGPAYARIGNRILYPRDTLLGFIANRVVTKGELPLAGEL